MLLNFILCVSCYLIYILLHVTNCYVCVVSIVFTSSGGTAAARRRDGDSLVSLSLKVSV